jgi:RNA polymerase primary sigma factor
MKLGDLVEDQVNEPTSVVVDRELLREQVVAALDLLPERERLVLERRFGVGDDRPRTLEDIAREIGVSRERVRQIEAHAIRRLRHPSRSRRLRDHLD